MAPKKNKSKLDIEEVADLSMGWRKSKMSEVAVQELETMGLLQSQAVIRKEKIILSKVLSKLLCSAISWNTVLQCLFLNSSILFFTSGKSNCII
jgi:hypothetical protein